MNLVLEIYRCSCDCTECLCIRLHVDGVGSLSGSLGAHGHLALASEDSSLF